MICPDTISADILRTVGWVKNDVRSVVLSLEDSVVVLFVGRVVLEGVEISDG